MVHELRHQPIRGLYLSYQVVTTLFFRFPYWLAISVPKSWRPRRSWTLKRCLWVHLLRHINRLSVKVGPIFVAPTHVAIHDGPGSTGVWVEMDPARRLISDELQKWAAKANVQPVRIPGYWMYCSGLHETFTDEIALFQKAGEKVLYRLHGGGYVQLSAHSSDPTAAIARDLLDVCKHIACAFSLEYRLSTSAPYPPSSPFPAALLDALAGYNYLVNIVGIAPQNIIVEGDSSGGNLALALVRYLVQYQDSRDVTLPAPPGGLIVISPRTDMSDSHETPNSSDLNSFWTDISPGGGHNPYGLVSYLGPHGLEAARTNPYLSPASRYIPKVDFRHFPRTFIVAGGAEKLRDQVRTLRDRMIHDMGAGDGPGQVRYYEAPDGIHVYPLFGWHEPERTDTLKAIAEWIDVGKYLVEV